MTDEPKGALNKAADALQQGAKAIGKLSDFVLDVFGPTVRDSVGIIHDRIAFIRWERKNRLIDRYYEIIGGRQFSGRRCAVPPKYALQILEKATLEENNTLQDMWIRLLAHLGDPATRTRIRTAFMGIIEQMEPIDAHILKMCYEYAEPRVETEIYEVQIPSSQIGDALYRDRSCLSKPQYQASIDNLMRLRCISSFQTKAFIESGVSYDRPFGEGSDREWGEVTHSGGYETICLTPLGGDFVEMCLAEGTRSAEPAPPPYGSPASGSPSGEA